MWAHIACREHIDNYLYFLTQSIKCNYKQINCITVFFFILGKSCEDVLLLKNNQLFFLSGHPTLSHR